MASESSSAILDLNDADTEDTEACSVTDDARDAPPLIMEQGYDIAVKVDAPMKQLSTLETYVTYRVRCVCTRWPTPPAVRRRYNHFKLLHKRLCSHQWVAPPPLPPLHTARQQLDRYSAAFVDTRTQALHAFLDRVAKHPIFSHSEDFRLFITTPDEDFDKVFKSENSAMNLWGLSSALYGSGENKPPANGPRVKDPEWSAHVEYLTSLQHKLTTLCTLTNKLHKGSAQLAAEWLNMKRACDAWSSQARGATARAAAATAAGAASVSRAPPPPRACRAVLPLLAAYTAAHVDKIRHRDQLHAAYVSGTNASGEMHNKLEQCTEALRSELADWLPKCARDTRGLLLQAAGAQVERHARAAAAWERAHSLAQDMNVEELFKTVSKTAVQNLSPSRCRSEMTPTETERDLDDLENYSNDSDSLIERTNERERTSEISDAIAREESELNDKDSDKVNDKDSERMNVKGSEQMNDKDSVQSDRRNDTFERDEREERRVNKDSDKVDVKDSQQASDKDWGRRYDEHSDRKNDMNSEIVKGNSKDKSRSDNSDKVERVNDSSESSDKVERVNDISEGSDKSKQSDTNSSGKTEWVEVEMSNDPLNINNVTKIQDREDFLSEILDDTEPTGSNVEKDSTSLEQSLKSDVVSDPLREFSDVELS